MSYHMAEKYPEKTRTPSDYLSDSDSSEEETSQHLCTSPEEILYNTIKGSVQGMQVALAHTTAQCNPTVERGPENNQRSRSSLKDKLQINQHRQKRKTIHNDILTLSSNILYFLYQNIFDIT